VIKGRSLPYGEVLPYGAFAAQVKQVAKIFDTDEVGAACEKLGEAVAELLDGDADQAASHIAMLIGLGSEGGVGDRQTLFFSAPSRRGARNEATDGARLRGHPLGRRRHAGPAGSASTSRVRDVPLFLLAPARPELLERRPTWGGGLPGYTALLVEPLGEEHARELAAQVLQQMQKPSHESGEIGLVGEGNPLFIEELAASVAEHATGGAAELPTTIRVHRFGGGWMRSRRASALSCSTRPSSERCSGLARSSACPRPGFLSRSCSTHSKDET